MLLMHLAGIQAQWKPPPKSPHLYKPQVIIEPNPPDLVWLSNPALMPFQYLSLSKLNKLPPKVTSSLSDKLFPAYR